MSNQKISEYADRYCCPQRSLQCFGNTNDYRCARGISTGGQVSYEKQPIGGQSQERAREQHIMNMTEAQSNKSINLAEMQNTGLPVYDQDYVATVYREVDVGKFAHVDDQHSAPHAQDHAHRQYMDAGQATPTCQPASQPFGQARKLVYRTTMVDPMHPPVQPLTAVDVHKLRYMTNNYMTADDWY